MQPRPAPSDLARHWSLDPGIVFLNHGSFGATPIQVLACQTEYRRRMEAEPVRFFVKDVQPLIDRAREALAPFVHARAEDLVFIPNATQAVATIMMNLEATLRPGDELLYTSQEYPACMNTLRRAAARTGATTVMAPLPFPMRSPDEIVNAIMAKVTPRTRALLISHVTSPTGLVLPVERIVPELESRGIACLVDGAHAPGMLADLDLTRLGASFYTANLHKWLCAPKGCAFLHVRPDRQKDFRPLALSNNAEHPKPGRKQLLTEFDFVGTADVTPWLCIPDSIREMAALVPGGWPEIMRRNRELCLWAREHLCRALGVEAPAPESMIGCIATMLLPTDPDPQRRARLAAHPSAYHDALQEHLINTWGIQVPVWSIPTEQPPRRLFRVSAQIYNTREQYEYLARALIDELARERAM